MQPKGALVKTHYVVVPVHVWENGAMHPGLDDGDPGPWGNTFISGTPEDEDGYWTFEEESFYEASHLVLERLGLVGKATS